MRRVLSVVLFVIGGWILVSGSMIAWMDVGQSSGMDVAMIAIFWAVSAPFLLLGMWASPGRRLRELGLTVLIAAAVGVAIPLMMLLMLNDPTFLRRMPPGQKLPQFKFSVLTGVVNLIIGAAVGWLLYSRGTNAPREAVD
ncbi:MAG TPA: hypothetical protein VFW39_12170 [Sphingomicrobium sp.]|nr:hypothetical protein [Sphingomicrobium sp.]